MEHTPVAWGALAGHREQGELAEAQTVVILLLLHRTVLPIPAGAGEVEGQLMQETEMDQMGVLV